MISTLFPRRKFATACIAVVLFVGASHTFALGTAAGSQIQNTAQASFDIGGVAQTPVSSTLQTQVDELIDVTVVDDIGGPVAVSSPQATAFLQFTITNTGNGSEVFRVAYIPLLKVRIYASRNSDGGA